MVFPRGSGLACRCQRVPAEPGKIARRRHARAGRPEEGRARLDPPLAEKISAGARRSCAVTRPKAARTAVGAGLGVVVGLLGWLSISAEVDLADAATVLTDALALTRPDANPEEEPSSRSGWMRSGGCSWLRTRGRSYDFSRAGRGAVLPAPPGS